MIPILSGILLALCFPKANLFFLAWVALIPLFYSIKKAQNLKQAALSGFLFSAAFFSINLAWLTTLSDYVGFWIYLGLFALIIFQSLYFIVTAVLIKIILNKQKKHAAILIPFVWVAIEWIRTLTHFGVAAGGLGYSQVSFLPIIQIASIFKVYGISFVIVFVNYLLFITYENRHNRKFVINMVIAIILIFATLLHFGYYSLKEPVSTENNPKISIIQGNIDQKSKMNFNALYEIYKKHEELTQKALKSKPNLIIWPETAVTDYLLNNPMLLSRVKNIAKDNKVYLLTGTPTYNEKEQIYNSLLAFSPDGKIIGQYNKQHLVPFGEYLPFRQILFPLLKSTNYFGQDYNRDNNPKLIEIGKTKFGAMICFESTLPYIAKQKKKMGADILLTITNDAWFKDSSALEKHLNMGIMRAVENRLPFIQAANTGISAIIDPYGRVLEQSKIDQAEMINLKL